MFSYKVGISISVHFVYVSNALLSLINLIWITYKG